MKQNTLCTCVWCIVKRSFFALFLTYVLPFAVQQSFYTDHTDDIICLAVNEHPKFKNVVVSGQIGAVPEVNVWDAMTKQTLSVLKVHKI